MNPPSAAQLHLGRAISVLRAGGAQRLDPVRFQFIEGLARRAAQHSGAAREVLDSKLAQALQDCAERLAQTQQLAKRAADHLASHGQDSAGWPEHAPRTLLADLLHHIAQQASAAEGSMSASAVATRSDPPAELRTLRLFRSSWSKLSVDQQLTESLAKVPENAGPLNSNLLVLRSLKLMRETSPAHLKRFMSYVDALLWLDEACVGAAPAKRIALRSESTHKRKPSRGKPG